MLLVIIPSITVIKRYFNKVKLDHRVKTPTKSKTSDQSKLYNCILANDNILCENGLSKPAEVWNGIRLKLNFYWWYARCKVFWWFVVWNMIYSIPCNHNLHSNMNLIWKWFLWLVSALDRYHYQMTQYLHSIHSCSFIGSSKIVYKNPYSYFDYVSINITNLWSDQDQLQAFIQGVP